MWTSGLSTPLSAQALKIHHTQENNRFIAPRHAPVPRQRRDSGAWVQSGPRRTSGRQKGDPRPDQKEEEEKEDGAVARRNSGKRAYIPTPLGEWDGQPFVFPPWTDEEDTQRSDRNTSCHICTQGSKSWRGNFTKLLACGFCPKIFCSRCLFHINGSDTVDESEAFIAEKQGTGWLCFMCCGICACQGHTGRPLDWHKRASWVGVTGGGLVMNKQKQPRMSMRSTRESAHQDQATEEETAAAEEPFVAAAALPVLATPERGSDGGAGLMVSPECIVREGTPVPSLSKPPPPPPPLAVVDAPPDARQRDADAKPCAPTPVPAPAPATAPTPAPQCGAALVGRKVRAYWEAEQDWFPGTLSAFNKRTKQHKISYDDGDWELVTLPDATVQLLE